MSKTIIEIVGKDLTGTAISSVQEKLSGLAGTALRVTGALSAIGVTGAVAGLAAMTKSVINAQDELNKLSQKTGISVESLAGIGFAAEQSGVEIEKVGKAARQFGILIAEANAGGKSAIDSLNNLGIAYTKLKDATPEEQLLALADALQQYSKEDRAIALTSTLGDRMADLVPLLSSGSAGFKELVEEGKRLNPVTAESAAASERFNDNLDRLTKAAGTFGISIANNILPALVGFTERVVDAQREGNVLIGVWRGLKEVFAGTAGLDDIGKKRKEVLDINSKLQSELKPGAFGDIFRDDNKIEFLKVQLRESTKELQSLIEKQTNLDRALRASDEGTKKFTASTASSASAVRSAGSGIKKLTDEQKRLAEEQRKIQSLFTEGQRLTESLDPWIKRNSQIKRYVELLQAGAIEQGIFNKAVAEANTDYEKAIGKLSDSTEDAVKGIKTLGDSSNKTFDEMSQFAIQAARNIQTSFANFFFDPFDDGLKGLVEGFGNAIRRFIAEAAALKTIQGLGLGNLIGVGGSSTGGLSALNAASIASSLQNGFSAANSTLTSALGGGFQSLGSLFGSRAVSSFGAGLSGQLSAFSNIGGAGTAFIGGPGTALGGTGLSGGAAASLGSSLGAAAGPLMAAAVATSIFKSFAGEKRLGGGFGKAVNAIGDIPILGDFFGLAPVLNTLFGRGPLKQKETNLIGNFTADDFQGITSTKFKAQGGLLVGDKTERVKIDTDTGKVIDDFTNKLDKFSEEMSKASRQIGLFLDSSIKGISTQFRDIAGDLGISAAAIDGFSASINIATEKGKGFTDEQLAKAIGDVSDQMASSLVPAIDGLSRAGESASDTLRRLGAEFKGLQNVGVVLGKTLQETKQILDTVSFSDRSSFVDSAGGIDELNRKTSFFIDNFLTASEKLEPSIELLADKMKSLGLSSNITRDGFKDLVQSFGKVGGISKELFVSLLDIAPLFLEVKNGIDLVSSSIDGFGTGLNFNPNDLLGSALNNLRASVENERQRITANYNKQIQSTEEKIKSLSLTVSKLSSLSDGLKSSINSIRGVGVAEAKQNISVAIESAKRGIFPELSDIQPSLNALLNQSESGFSTREDFERSKAANANLIKELSDLTDTQLDATNDLVSSAEKQKATLVAGFDREMARLDGILSNSQREVETLLGINNVLLDIETALLSLGAATGTVKKALDDQGKNTNGSPASILGGEGNKNISNSDIKSFITSSGKTNDDILKAALQYNVSAKQIADAMENQNGFTLDNIRKFAASRGITGFAAGGYHPGGARIVGEFGPELEVTGPSAIYSNRDSRSLFDSAGIIQAINSLSNEIRAVAAHSKKTADMLLRVTRDGNALVTTA